MTALERFKQYISYDTRSCGTGPDTPADSKPPELVQALAAELAQLGLQSVRIHSDGYLCGWLPSSPGCEGVPCVGLIASLSNTPGNRAGLAELLTAVELLSCQPALCHGRVALAAAPADTGGGCSSSGSGALRSGSGLYPGARSPGRNRLHRRGH